MLDGFAAAALRPQPDSEPASYAVGRFVLRRRERVLLRDGREPVELGSRAVEVLLALVEADGALLTKGALLDQVWPGVVVEENNLHVQVSALRRALGPQGRDWIATVPGRGYRFTGPVAAISGRNDAGASLGTEPTPLHGEPEPLPLSVLVLPFAGRGAGAAGRWFADGITDSLTTDLTRALPPGSSVVAQASAETYRGHPADVRAIGREQGARYVVEGSVLLAGERVRVNAQLIAAETGAHVWAERFDTPRRDVLRDQDEIVGRLARAVGLQVLGAEARRAEQVEREHPEEEATAEDYVLRAHAMAHQDVTTGEGAETARALYAAALARDPGNADALAGIAFLQIYQVVNGVNGTAVTRRGGKAAREATLAEAEARLAQALAAVPGHLKALKGRAVLLRARGLFADAIAVAETVLARTPGDPIALRETGLNLLYLGRTEEAVGWFQRADALALPSDPARWTWLQALGRALIQLGRDAEAADALRLALASKPGFAFAHALLAAALALAGDDARARSEMAAFRRAEPGTPPGALARRCAVPFEATDPLYRERNARVLDGLRRAAALGADDAAASPAAA